MEQGGNIDPMGVKKGDNKRGRKITKIENAK